MTEKTERGADPNVAVLAKLESVMRRVKRALYWQSSRDTADFVQSLVEKWIRSEEYARLLEKAPDDISVYQSAKTFVIDHLRTRDAAKRRPAALVPLETGLQVPSEEKLEALVADAEALHFVRAEVARLARGEVRDEAKALLKAPKETADVLKLTMEGATNAEIARTLEMSTGQVSKRLQEGCAYLAKPLLANPRQR